MTVQIPAQRPPAPGPVDQDVQAILDALNADPELVGDRAKVITAVLQEAREHDGQIDPNRVRARLADPTTGRPAVSRPQVIGAVYNALAHAGVIEFAGWVTSTDRASGNAGRPARSYRLERIPAPRQH